MLCFNGTYPRQSIIIIRKGGIITNFNCLREKYPNFSYDGYKIKNNGDSTTVIFDFSLDGECEFHPTWNLPFAVDEKDVYVREIIFSLGMTEAVSYWKAACPKTFTVKAGFLDENRVAFWKKLYFNGLGEFFYLNKIDTDIDDFMNIVCEYDGAIPQFYKPKALNGCLIPIGGGKDSVVTSELLRDYPEKAAYMINPKRCILDTASIAGFGDNTVKFSRTLDKNLLRLNSEGFLNGHTPFSAIVAFSALLAAYATGKKYIVLSNESSANEATVGDNINHQYSKSLKFERDFREYVSQFIPCRIEYFSMLRPFAEIRIARYFSKFPQYFDAFLSCNLGSKTDCWCGKCPKCLFIFLMLMPFIPQKRLTKIFGSDLSDREDMLTDFYKLLGVTPEKPFECVGSRDEVILACKLACENHSGELPLLLHEFIKLNLNADESILSAFDKENFIPQEFLPYLTPM